MLDKPNARIYIVIKIRNAPDAGKSGGADQAAQTGTREPEN